ncbi:hypothetical protein [Nocardia pseudovaccinii]|uniref:hypothetical protein n=1 Tax=Nocardia pseudovaccinii TaxID=189540 RepID=UPI0007A49A68|nr:hypothetical protein [Nocardia pseudovaccinii]
MSLIAYLAIAVLIAVVLWTVGPITARIVGGLGVLVCLAALATGGSASWISALMLSVLLWLLGHILTAYKKRTWRSRLAQAIVARTPLLRMLDPLSRRGPTRRTPRRLTPRRAVRRPRTPRARTRMPPGSPQGAEVGDFELWEREIAADRHDQRRAQSPGEDS